ncbi:sensor histidine kinase [Serratia fonticola]|uniref:histidine kinase n=1 Tax=Serratia fonticola TaxID=47917 RepID=A0ABY9PTC8_SERFO|nr:ATP-binding protein [Serratia fonticola]WMT16048.1 ATP-binding protein [Serratia fonticola]
MKIKNRFKVIIFIKFYLFCLLSAFAIYGIMDFVTKRTTDIITTRAYYTIIRETIALLEEKYLSQKDNDYFNKKMTELNYYSIYTISIDSMANLHEILSPEQHGRMLQGGIIFTHDNIALKRITGTNQVIFINTKAINTDTIINDEFALGRYVIYYEIAWAASLVALFAYVWLAPIWRDVLKIREQAILLSSGKSGTRGDETESDIFKPIAIAMNDMVDKIQAATLLRRTMTHSMAHELRTPITRIKFHLHSYFGTDEVEKKKSIVNSVHQEIYNIESLIETILNYASIENHSKIISPQKQYISTWFDEKIELFFVGSHNIKLIKKYDDNLGWVYMDVNLMVHVFNNLLSNAKKYTTGTVLVSVKRTEEMLTFTVEDDGAGISLEDYEKIFEPFYRGKGNKSSSGTGFGLGLAIVHKIVDLHRGKVSVEKSKLGGACFIVEVPCDYQK